MVMSGGGNDDPRESTGEGDAVVLDWSFQNHAKEILRRDAMPAPISEGGFSTVLT
jgi:hypothetical protein